MNTSTLYVLIISHLCMYITGICCCMSVLYCFSDNVLLFSSLSVATTAVVVGVWCVLCAQIGLLQSRVMINL